MCSSDLDGLYPTHYAGWAEVGNVRSFIKDPSGSTANPDREAALRGKAHALFDDLGSQNSAVVLEGIVDKGVGPANALLDAII